LGGISSTSWGNSVSSSGSNWGSSNTNSSRGSSITNSRGSSGNRDMRDSVDWGGMSSHNSLGGVGLICGMVDMRGLNDLLDGVDLVGSWDRDSTGNGDLVWLGNMVDLDNLTGNGTWDSNRDINVVLLYVQLWDNVGDLRSDPGVGSDGSSDLGLNNGVSGSRSSWDRGRRNGSIWCWGSRDDWGWESLGLNEVLGSSGNIRGSRLRDGLLSGNNVVVASNNLLDSGLNSPVSNNSIFNMVLNYWGSSSIRVMSLSNNCWGVGNWCTNNMTSTGITDSSNNAGISLGHGSTEGTSHESTSDHKSVHVFSPVQKRLPGPRRLLLK